MICVTRVVPAVVPSDLHRSNPPAALMAAKYIVLPTTVRPLPATGFVVTSCVPAAVPLVFHRPRPLVVPVAQKYNLPLNSVIADGCDEWYKPVLRSITIDVPAAVPSLRHSSLP